MDSPSSTHTEPEVPKQLVALVDLLREFTSEIAPSYTDIHGTEDVHVESWSMWPVFLSKPTSVAVTPLLDGYYYSVIAYRWPTLVVMFYVGYTLFGPLISLEEIHRVEKES